MMNFKIFKMNLKSVFIVFFVFVSLGMKSQNIYVNEEPSIKQLFDNYLKWNTEKDYVLGWRIQIINTDDRRKMERAISNFRYRFPGITNVSWEQISPYYRVKVGGFYSKLKAQAFLDEVKEYFPSAITVWEKIKESEFLENID